MKITVEKFKRIDFAEVSLDKVNIFIGANNSGKSSFIQGIQFAVSSCQTLTLKGAHWRKKHTQTLGLDSSDFLYSPTKFIEDLYNGRKLVGARRKEDRKRLKFTFSRDSDETSVSISRSKNGGFDTTVEGRNLGIVLGSVDRTFCVYVPGLAGVPIEERHAPPITIKKSAIRGDSNNFLRNILLSISQKPESWDSFIESVNLLYPGISISASYDEYRTEFIQVHVTIDGHQMPLDSVGTGLLQVIQAFAYIEYFNPQILLLDEPDAHIHPTKQRILATELLRKANESDDLRIVFSTHSRYILAALEGKAKVFHFQHGEAMPNVQGSKILLDIGAADADYLFAKKKLKYVIATEDKVDGIEEKKAYLKTLLLSSGLQEDEFVLHSYEGCTKVDSALTLQGFVRKQIPTAKVIIHFDRDQRLDDDEDILNLVHDCEQRSIHAFITELSEVENYFCQPAHLQAVYNLSEDESQAVFDQCLQELEQRTKDKLSNFILQSRPRLARNANGRTDIAVLRNNVDEIYSEHKSTITPGKELLGKVKNHLQSVLRKDPNIIHSVSSALKSQALYRVLMA
jgi:predicted ATPase